MKTHRADGNQVHADAAWWMRFLVFASTYGTSLVARAHAIFIVDIIIKRTSSRRRSVARLIQLTITSRRRRRITGRSAARAARRL